MSLKSVPEIGTASPNAELAHGRVTLRDVAAHAGVSTATADRVINRRPGVRAATVHKVFSAATALGYLPPELAGAGAEAPLRIVFLLPRGSNPYLKMLGETVVSSAAHYEPYNVRCTVEWAESFNPQAQAAALRRIARRADGIVFMALEHPAVREAVNAVAEQGVAVITAISDLSNSRRIAYVGIDNRAAGRTAAYLLARFIGRKDGEVALFAGSLNYLAHQERENGFLQLHAEAYPELRVVGMREGYDDAERNYLKTIELVKRHPRMAGIYNAGGSSDGIGKALKEMGLDQKIVLIGHGLTPDTRAMLISGAMDAVITQSYLGTVMSSIQICRSFRDGRELLAAVDLVRSQVVFRENLP